MDYVIESEVLLLDDNNPGLKYASISGAYYMTTKVDEVGLV